MSIFYIILIDPLPESLAVDITEANTLSDDKTIPKDKLTFAHLKELILIATKRTSPTVYRRIHEVKSLWKIENLVEGKDRWGELEGIAKEKNDIEQNQNLRDFGGVKLISSNLVRNTFPDYDFPEEHVHIIVTVEPQPPATTGKRRLDYDWSEDRDRKKDKLTVLEAILIRAKKIMEDIKKLPGDCNVYSNPETLILLPFPFLGERKPVERFSINNDNKFMYMGRKVFVNVLNTINELKHGCGYMNCFIYGTMGYGKSYILAMIVCFLFRTGKRVVYLPDCHGLAMDTVDYVKSALYLAYENNSDKISEINDCDTLDEIVKFCKGESEPLYIVVDQLNALDGHNNTGIDETTKQQIVKFLNQIATKHYYIKSSSANNTSALYLKLKQTNEIKIELYGGFDEDEMSQWWIKNNSNLPSMDDKQRKEIEYTTGQNPLFLSFLPGSEKNFDDAWKRLKPILMEKIQVPMTNFSDIIDSKRWDIHIKLMLSCLTNDYAPSGYGINDYDHRFFYIDKDQCCHYTSGFVRDCMADYLFEKGKLEAFATSSWIQCIKEFKNNSSVMGFMVKKACLSSINL